MTTATEMSALLPTTTSAAKPTTPTDATTTTNGSSPASASSTLLSAVFVALQAVLLGFFWTCTAYEDESYEYDVKEYIAYRDIMAMLLLGFGYLMTFLKLYGLGAVGFTLMLSVLAMELNIAVEFAMRCLYSSAIGGEGGDSAAATSFPLSITVGTLIDSEFAAAALLITYGALIGRATPLQLVLVAAAQSVPYAFNKVVLVLGAVGAEDVGGTMTIHMFGAYYGLAASCALSASKQRSRSQQKAAAAAAAASSGERDDDEEEEELLYCHPDKVSDVMALIGTTILWVYWPSFVGATETGHPRNERRCILNTVLALLASTTMTFYLSYATSGSGGTTTQKRFDPVHVANSTLAGGVAIGSAGRMNLGPGWAVFTGMAAGAASVCGYKYSTPHLQSTYHIYDTCGVGNLHGYPSLVGAALSVFFVAALDPDADFLASPSNAGLQVLRQIGGIASTLLVSIASGYGSGLLAARWGGDEDADDDSFLGAKPSYTDSVWWHLEY
jgi:ammonium transporter Rh